MLNRNVDIKSPLSKEEFLKRLSNTVERKTNPKFEGSIKNDSFRLLQLFNYGPRNLMRPQIDGMVIEKQNHISIRVKFSIQHEQKLFISGVLIINLILALFNLIPHLIEDPIYNRLFFFGFIMVTLIFGAIGYFNKVDQCIKEISNIAVGKLMKMTT